MGGLNSEITEKSSNMIIEKRIILTLCTIRRGAKTVGISSEASYRFERGALI
jgi:phenylalanyl-tRNA synthetase beta chain